jgi:hypothetical protein
MLVQPACASPIVSSVCGPYAITPPGRATTSIEERGTSRPSGASHSASCSGSSQAWKTSSRAASKVKRVVEGEHVTHLYYEVA